MLAALAFDQRHRLRQQCDVALAYAFHIVGCGERSAARTRLEVEIRVGHWRLLNAFVYGQACIFFAVLGMFHVYFEVIVLSGY